ncbi:MAG: DNA-3-methyladenine glycosylase [Candidatus Pacebacteria bacterium]|nr:DNA-3-methyladenine glycosylase [Candidatus Paceibacterota bacterium]
MFPTFLNESADSVAKKLLGCFFERTINNKKILVRIVETEAYDQDDEASHTYRGKTQRNATMFGESGHLYVYFTYGMHYCCNVVASSSGYGAGVLIRAVEPVEGIEIIQKLRKNKMPIKNLTNGPGKLCQGLGIDKKFNGHDLREDPLKLITGKLQKSEKIIQTTRIGVSQAQNRKRRFYIKGNLYISKNS